MAHATSAASFTASLDRDTIALGDTAVLNLVFEGGGQIQLSPLPSLPGLVVSGPQQSQSVNIVNGQQTQTLTVSYYLRPTETNTFIIPGLTAVIQGQQFTSSPLTLRVVPAVGAGAARLVVPRDRLYVGEPLVVELQLLMNSQVRSLVEFNVPTLAKDGWETGRVSQPQERQGHLANDRITIVSYQVPLMPLQPGKRRLGPVDTSMVVNVALPRQRGDPFADFGFFGGLTRTEPRRIPINLPVHEIEVLPLPAAGRPEGFAGAVGQFQLDVSVGPTNLAVGDPITVRVQISGRGNFNQVTLPDELFRGDFRSYPAEKRFQATDHFGFAGVYSFEQVVVPQNTEVSELPGLVFSYFDPHAETYQTLSRPPTPLLVRPAGSTPAPVITLGAGQSQSDAPPAELLHIKQRLGSPAQATVTGSLPTSFIVWNTLPALAFLAALAWRKRGERLERDPRLRRRQEAQRFVAQGLVSLHQHAAAGEGEAFFTLLFRVLQESIGAALDQPASGITESVVDERLRRAGLDDEDAAMLNTLFHACDQARYAPVRDRQELSSLLDQLESVLGALKEVKA